MALDSVGITMSLCTITIIWLCLSASGKSGVPSPEQINEVKVHAERLNPRGADWSIGEPYMDFRFNQINCEKYEDSVDEDLLLHRDTALDKVVVPKLYRGIENFVYSFMAEDGFTSYRKERGGHTSEWLYVINEFRKQFPTSEGYAVSRLRYYGAGEFLAIHKGDLTRFLIPINRAARARFARSPEELESIKSEPWGGTQWYYIDFKVHDISAAAPLLRERTRHVKQSLAQRDSVHGGESPLSN